MGGGFYEYEDVPGMKVQMGKYEGVRHVRARKKYIGSDSGISARNRKYGPRPWLRKKPGSIWSSLSLKRSSQSFVEVKNRLMAADRRLDASLR